MSPALYTTIGHVTIDVLENGVRRPGGTAFYSALQAARLGLRARILTRGVPSELERLLAPHRDEFELEVIEAAQTTTLVTRGSGPGRRQRIVAWAGPIVPSGPVHGDAVHLAPVARETPAGALECRPGVLGLTPQGLVRSWDIAEMARSGGAPIELAAPEPGQRGLAARCDALVLSEAERDSCAELIDAARSGGACVAITAGGASKTLLLPGDRVLRLRAAAVSGVRDDLGAGDVFAAAFFVSLLEGLAAPEAARFASSAAALRIEGEGPDAIATRSEIERRLGG